eukprot:29467-Pelagococcus_subviridis.AAC.5
MHAPAASIANAFVWRSLPSTTPRSFFASAIAIARVTHWKKTSLPRVGGGGRASSSSSNAQPASAVSAASSSANDSAAIDSASNRATAHAAAPSTPGAAARTPGAGSFTSVSIASWTRANRSPPPTTAAPENSFSSRSRIARSASSRTRASSDASVAARIRATSSCAGASAGA